MSIWMLYNQLCRISGKNANFSLKASAESKELARKPNSEMPKMPVKGILKLNWMLFLNPFEFVQKHGLSVTATL